MSSDELQESHDPTSAIQPWILPILVETKQRPTARPFHVTLSHDQQDSQIDGAMPRYGIAQSSEPRFVGLGFDQYFANAI